MTSATIPGERLFASQRGKWSKLGVPHRGWTCVEIEDLGQSLAECEMCESQMIRYVHYMKHPEYPEVLGVGCVCAGNMEGDLMAARQRETTLQSRAAKRKRWLSRKWKISAKGNPYIIADGFRVTVWPRDGGWDAAIAYGDENPIFIRRSYPQQAQAKLAAFDYITKLLAARLSENGG